jgi:ABC-type phosphate transport system permease subunit
MAGIPMVIFSLIAVFVLGFYLGWKIRDVGCKMEKRMEEDGLI